MFIGAERRAGSGPALQPVDRHTASEFAPSYPSATESDVADACELAWAASRAMRSAPPRERATLLSRIADEIERDRERILDRADRETALGAPRLDGELARTTGQLRMFAELVADGYWADHRIDSPMPDGSAELRSRSIGVGPVAVFGASNFPLAFSVAGGDTASALAAGCPVIVKAHEAHLGTGELVGAAISRAIAAVGAHPGTFSMLYGAGADVATMLVANERVRAVGFTGSRAAGTAIAETAARRPVPIPVFAEMSAVNPCLLLPAALEQSAEQLAADFVASLTLGGGQFCTNPGLVIAVRGPGFERFIETLESELVAVEPEVMLTDRIQSTYAEGADRRAGDPDTRAFGPTRSADRAASFPLVVSHRADIFLARPDLQEELFGPAAVLVECDDLDDMRQVIASLQGQLTASLHGGDDDGPLVAEFVPLLEEIAGRILYNEWPTGVRVSHAMVHGGPYPATTDGRFTSVGPRAIDRFLRPVCYQNLPATALPAELTDAELQRAPRFHDGRFEDPSSVTSPCPSEVE